MAVLSLKAYAQVTADTLDLDPVTVSATRIETDLQKQPVLINIIDSAMVSRANGMDLGYTLQQFSNIYIRNNGPGAASVISQRGLSGAQTRVVWEGLPLNHQMLGVTDLSLIQSTMISAVAVSGGSSSSSFGSGIGGSVVLQTDTETGLVEAGQIAGSFGNFITHGKAGLRLGRWDFGLSASVQNNENDFLYYDVRSGTRENRSRGSFDNEQVMLQTKYRGDRLLLKTAVWYSSSNHEIAENIFSGPGQGTQFDESLRLASTLQFSGQKSSTEINVQGAVTTLDYVNPLIGVNSLSENREARLRLNHTYGLSDRIKVTATGIAGYTQTETNNYDRLRSRSWLSGGLKGVIQPGERLSLYPAIRIDSYSDFGTALSPGLGVNYQIMDEVLGLRFSVNRNFRAPTFNDLYWPNGGNEAVNAEYSMTYEAGLIHTTGNVFSIQNQLSVFLIDLDDGIRWLPEPNGQFIAQNVEEIRSQGVEWENTVSGSIGKLDISWQQLLSYTYAYYSKARFAADAAEGNQLPYVPKWQWKGSLNMQFQQVSVFMNNRMNSLRYTTEQEDPNFAADGYWVSDIGASYLIPFRDLMIRIGFRVNNIFDERYDIVRFYPMPLRNGMATINLKYKL
ncbi:TonB-dependent receptor plug domain-containing protein [Balneola sp. MJW-20]|uniref:TonB-dependent receptor plug domain-containing protein n=1 Tax=Gracilimonas aurantiaca TaxID=3234185 RepID=UPI0034668823